MRFGPKEPVARNVIICIGIIMLLQGVAIVVLLGHVLQSVGAR